MKISYNDINLKKDFKHFNEWYLLCTTINSIKKKGYFKSNNFIIKNLVFLIFYILVFIIMINAYQSNAGYFINTLGIFLIAFCVFAIICYILIFVGYFIHYSSFKKTDSNNKKNILTIGEEGIIDVTKDITLTSKWEQLTHVIIGKYYVTITTTTNIMYVFPIDIKDKLVSNINKYNSNKELKIIETSIRK